MAVGVGMKSLCSCTYHFRGFFVTKTSITALVFDILQIFKIVFTPLLIVLGSRLIPNW